MPLRSNQFREKVSDFEAEWEGEPIKGKYRPGVLTGGFIEEMWERPIQEVVQEMCVETDIIFGEDDENIPEELRGKPVPMDKDILLKYVPREVCYAIFNGMFAASKGNVPNEKTG